MGTASPTRSTTQSGSTALSSDSLTIYSDTTDPVAAQGSDDRLEADRVAYDLIGITMIAGAGNDVLVGSPFADVLNSGLGDDTVTGGPGVDVFADAGGNDTLIEARDWDLALFGNHFVVGRIIGDEGGDFYKTSFVDANGQTIDPFNIDFDGDPDPQMPGLRDTGDHFAAARARTDSLSEVILEVEDLPLDSNSNCVFENATITGGDSNNVMVVGDQDNRIYAGGTEVTVQGWTGKAILDNKVARLNGSSQSEYYIVNLDGQSGGTVVINDTGGTEGYDELYLFGTAGNDQVYLNSAGSDQGLAIFGNRFDPAVPYTVDVTSSVAKDKAYLAIANKNPAVPVALLVTGGTSAVVPAADGAAGFRVKLTGTVVVGATWTVTVDGAAYSYTVRRNDKLLDIARGLQAAILGVNPHRDEVLYSSIERLTIRTQDGDDSVLSDDIAVVTVVELGRGDDSIVIGTVPQIPDEGNKNLEFPDGVPVADTENMTNGNSFTMYVFGQTQDDTFEVNHNVAELYLAGGDHDDTFIINTFIALKKNPNKPDEITNLTRLFGGKGSNRYEYVQNAPVYINGGYGIDTLVINGTPIDDQFVITDNYVAGAGRIVYYSFIERLEVNGAGGKDEIYVLSSPADMEITVRGGSNDDIIYLGGEAPAQVFDPPAFKYQPPPFTVQDPPVVIEEIKTRPVQTFNASYSWWDTVWAPFADVAAWAKVQILIDVAAWYAGMKAQNPYFHLVSHSSLQNILDQVVITKVEKGWSKHWWLFWDPIVNVTYQTPEIRYAIGHQVLPEPRVIQPAPVTVDPPAFALKSTAKLQHRRHQGPRGDRRRHGSRERRGHARRPQ